MSPRDSSASAPLQIPEQLKPLVENLARLSDEDRELVIRAARPKRLTKVGLKAMPWETLWLARGVVSLGGNAVEDCNAIYDV